MTGRANIGGSVDVLEVPPRALRRECKVARVRIRRHAQDAHERGGQPRAARVINSQRQNQGHHRKSVPSSCTARPLTLTSSSLRVRLSNPVISIRRRVSTVVGVRGAVRGAGRAAAGAAASRVFDARRLKRRSSVMPW